MSSDLRYSSKRGYNKGSSTRATLRERPETGDMMIKGLKRQVKECNEVIGDLKKLVDLNKEAMIICATTTDDKKRRDPLMKENTVLLEGLLRNFSFQEKLGLMCERYKAMMEEMENRLKLLQDDMAERMGSLMIKLAYYEKENRYEELAGKFMSDLENIAATFKNVEEVKNYHKKTDRFIAWKDKVKKLEMEKKELLKVNFDLSSEIMKMKALLSTSKGYKSFMNQNKEVMPGRLKENFEEQVNKIITFHQKYLKNKPDADEDFDGDGSLSAENYEVFDTEMVETEPFEDENDGEKKKSSNKLKLDLGSVVQNGGSKPPNSKGVGIGFKLDLTKAMLMQEDMAKKMMDKANKEKTKNRSRLEKAELIQQKYDKLDKEHIRILKMVNEEMETTSLFQADNHRLRNLNQHFLNINKILIKANAKSEKRRRKLEKNIILFRRAYMAFNFFLEKGKKNGDWKGSDLARFVTLLSSQYDPDKDYTLSNTIPKSNRDGKQALLGKDKLNLSRAKAFASHIHDDVSNLQLVKRVEEGEKLPATQRNEGRQRSYSLKGENLEDLEQKFEQKMEENDQANASFSN